MTFLNFLEYYLHGKTAAKHFVRTVLLALFCIFSALILSPDTSLFSATVARDAAEDAVFSVFPVVGETALEEETAPDNKVLFDSDRTAGGGMLFVQIGNGRLSKNFSTRIPSGLHWLVHFVNRPFGGKSAEKDVSNSEVLEELDALAVAACNEEHITPVQEQIIRQIPGLKDDTVSDIMVSPEEMVCIHSEMTRDEVLQVMKNSPHSRYPVRDGKTGNRFVGVLTIRQMLVQNTDWMHLIWKVTVVHPQCTMLEIAEKLDQYDSKLLLVGEDPDHIIGMFTTNDLISSLFRPNEEEKEEEAPLQ